MLGWSCQQIVRPKSSGKEQIGLDLQLYWIKEATIRNCQFEMQ